jgi:flagellar biosynthetic protein FliR
MERWLELTPGDLEVFLLVFFRISGVLFLAPVFGGQMSPAPVKIFLSLLLAMLLLPTVGRPASLPEPSLAALAWGAFLELSTGALIGFAATLLFAAVQFGGQLIDQELGLMMANVLDPLSNEQVSIIAQFKLFLAVIVYLLIDGHHFLIAATRDSFAAVPIMGLGFGEGAAHHLTEAMARDVFRMAVQIAAPAMATLFLVTVAMAFMARTVPEMNVFILGFSLRIAVGFGVLAFGVGFFVYGFQEMTQSNSAAIRRLLELLGGS